MWHLQFIILSQGFHAVEKGHSKKKHHAETSKLHSKPSKILFSNTRVFVSHTGSPWCCHLSVRLCLQIEILSWLVWIVVCCFFVLNSCVRSGSVLPGIFLLFHFTARELLFPATFSERNVVWTVGLGWFLHTCHTFTYGRSSHGPHWRSTVASEWDFVQRHLPVTSHSQVGKPEHCFVSWWILSLDIKWYDNLRCQERPPTTGCWQVTSAWLDFAWQTLS